MAAQTMTAFFSLRPCDGIPLIESALEFLERIRPLLPNSEIQELDNLIRDLEDVDRYG